MSDDPIDRHLDEYEDRLVAEAERAKAAWTDDEVFRQITWPAFVNTVRGEMEPVVAKLVERGHQARIVEGDDVPWIAIEALPRTEESKNWARCEFAPSPPKDVQLTTSRVGGTGMGGGPMGVDGVPQQIKATLASWVGGMLEPNERSRDW